MDAEVGPYTTSEIELAKVLVERLAPGMLLIADRGFCGYPLWRKAAATGADLLWRARTNMAPRHVEDLADASWLAELRPGGNAGRAAEPAPVRVIEFTIDDGRGETEPFRLFTTILDPSEASAAEPAAAYVLRWEIELAFDELKTHQRGARTVLRSKSPDLIRQEIWGYLCCHYAIRTLMWEAADHAHLDPHRVSFVAALRIARRSLPAARDFPPRRTDHGWRHAIGLLLQRLNPARRRRANPRLIKRKMPKWHVKRARHRDWPQPTRPPTITIHPTPN